MEKKDNAVRKTTLIALIAVGVIALLAAVPLLKSLLHRHSWTEATCTEPKKCSSCGAVEGNALGHSWKDASCMAAKTCTVCGATEGNPLGHNWKEATCTEAKICTVCGRTEGEALGHSWMNATCIEPKTCSICGAVVGTAAGHSWAPATCTRAKECGICGVTEGNPHGHSWKTAADGKTRTCSVCGESDNLSSSESGVDLFTANTAFEARNSVAVAHSGSLEACRTCVRRLQENGYNAFLYEVPDQGGYSILIGVFGTAQEAKEYAEYLHAQPEVKGVKLDGAYAISKVYLSDDAASRYKSPDYNAS